MNVKTRIGRRRPLAVAVVSAMIGVAAFAMSGTAQADSTTPPSDSPSSASASPSATTAPSTSTAPATPPSTSTAPAGAAKPAVADTSDTPASTSTAVTLQGTAIAGQGATLVATVDPAPDGGTVTFDAGGDPIDGCSDVDLTSGTADCTATFSSTGPVDVTAVYSGDDSFATSTGDLSVTVVDSADADAAANYLIAQLVDGDHIEYSGGYGPNYGGSIDIALALAAEGGHNDVLTDIVNYISKHVADYADPDGTAAEYPGPYTGAVAKTALLAEVTGNDPNSFGGFDLIKTLLDNVCTAATSDGNCTAAGDFSQVFSTVGQSLGVLALARDGDTVPALAVTRLEQLQCSDGGFNSLPIAPGADCTSDVDSTGFAIQALTLVPGTGAVVAKAVSFLEGAQHTDGGFTGAAGENSNSTALAIQGLIAADSASPSATASAKRLSTHKALDAPAVSSAVAAAQAWLASMQNSDGGFGISLASPASDETATAQSLPAILGLTLGALSDPLTTTGGGGGGTSAGGGTTTTTGPGTIANTGTDVSVMLELAFLLLAAGVAMTVGASRRGRRPTTVAAHRVRV